MMHDKQNRLNGIWFVHDFCGILCTIFTWILILFSQYSVLTSIILPETDKFYKIFNFIIFEILLNLALISHLKCVFTDPGTVPRGSATREAIESLGLDPDSMKIIFKCQKCCAIKPERSHHCSVCNRCIKKMDHHCPWINNCVGIYTQKYFILFTLYIALVSTYTLVITILHLINCIKNDWSYCDSKPLLSIFSDNDYLESKSNHATPYSIILIVILIFESLLFSIFTMIMLGTQIQCIFNDQTGIENLKKETKYSTRKLKNRSFIKRLKILLSEFKIEYLNPLTNNNFTSSNLDLKSYTHYV